VSKLQHVGSEKQLDEFDLDGDDEAPWHIGWSEGPEHSVNRDIVTHWVSEVMNDKEVSIIVSETDDIDLPNMQMNRLHRKHEITDEQFSEDFVHSPLPHMFDTIKKFIKINQDQSGRRSQRLAESKECSKRKERRREVGIFAHSV
jgi:hypothetical protein